MTTSTHKPVAKSLHTVTVICQVARHMREAQGLGTEDAIGAAMELLGLAGRNDPYALQAAATRLIDRD